MGVNQFIQQRVGKSYQ